MKLRKVMALILATAMTAALIGCGQATPAPTAEEPAAEEAAPAPAAELRQYPRGAATSACRAVR